MTNLYSTHIFYKRDRGPHKKLAGQMLVTVHGLNTNALVVTVTRLRAARLKYRTLTPGRDRMFSLLYKVRTMYAVRSNAYPACTGLISVNVKEAGA